MVSREAVPFYVFILLDLRVRQLRGGGGLPILESILRINCGHLRLKVIDLLLCQLLLAFLDVVIKVEVNQVLRLFAFFISHAEGTCPSLYALQLILKHVATAVALNNEQDFPPLHLIQIFVAVAPDLAYDYFEGLVGVCAFFRLPFPSRSSISGLMVFGTCNPSLRICNTVVTRFCTSSRLA